MGWGVRRERHLNLPGRLTALSRELDLDVSGVGVLESITEDGSDGANADWGVWVEPRLQR